MVAVTEYYGFVGAKEGLTPDEEYAEMEHFRSEPWPMVFGDKKNFEAYEVTGIPQWVVLDRQGNVAFIHVGYSPANFGPFREKVAKLVGG